MTATATISDVKDMKECLGFKDDQMLVLRASPVQQNVKFITVRRPPNGTGFDGDISGSGTFKPGLGNLLDILLIKKFASDINQGIEPKKAIIYSLGLNCTLLQPMNIYWSYFHSLKEITNQFHSSCAMEQWEKLLTRTLWREKMKSSFISVLPNSSWVWI